MVALSSSKAGSPATLTYLIGYPSRISNHILDILKGISYRISCKDISLGYVLILRISHEDIQQDIITGYNAGYLSRIKDANIG